MSEEHDPAPAVEKAAPRKHIHLDQDVWDLLFQAAKPDETPEETLSRVLRDRMKKEMR